MALGLGDIRVLSRPGQPLLAEIPVVSADPGELEAARVALASPATFARVGLERPSGLVEALQFDFAQDAQGRAVIRVRSAQAVDVPVVSFLIEVDWGQGRLVREYSALVDRPHTATAIDAPQIQAPSQAPSNVIVREPAAAVAPAAPLPAAAAPAAAETPAAPAPVPSALLTAMPSVTPVPASGPLTVQAGQTLSQIAVDLARGSSANLEQTMVALLQANPQAFIGGNIHRLRSGAQLQLPDAQALSSVNAGQARAIVREQTGQWQQARAALPQPELAQGASSPAVQSNVPAPAPAAAAGARLEIAPAVAVDGAATASVSGTEAGAQGDMLVSEQLRQAREDLATRDAEVAELRERVAELEKLREQQSALIELKDNEMAAAQEQVAQAAEPAASEGGGGWIFGGGLLLVGAALVAWLARRRKPSPLPPLDADAAAAGHGLQEPEPALSDEPVQQDAPVLAPEPEPEPEPAARATAGALDAEQMIAALRNPLPPVQPEAVQADTDSAPLEPQPELAASEPAEPASRIAPHQVFDPFQLPPEERELPQQPVAAPSPEAGQRAPRALPTPGSRERLELAIAYLDLGDAITARSLLEEVVAAGDRASREQAMELLGRLA